MTHSENAFGLLPHP